MADDDDDFVSEESETELCKTPPPQAIRSAGKVNNWRSALRLKPEHAARPITVAPDRSVYLEVFSKHYARAREFLAVIADPISQPQFIHVFVLTSSSLFSALSLGLTSSVILEVLGKLSKCPIPDEVSDFVTKESKNFGVAKLLLKQQKVFIESKSKRVLETIIDAARCGEHSLIAETEDAGERPDLARFTDWEQELNDMPQDAIQESTLEDAVAPAPSAPDKSWEFPVAPRHLEAVRKCALEEGFPLTEEYAFGKDAINPHLPIELRKNCNVRGYQQQSLSRMITGGRARSGLIVLPCGAGKTLTGISACSAIKKSTMVLCTSYVAVEQWRSQYKRFTTLPGDRIVRFTSKFVSPFSWRRCMRCTNNVQHDGKGWQPVRGSRRGACAFAFYRIWTFNFGRSARRARASLSPCPLISKGALQAGTLRNAFARR